MPTWKPDEESPCRRETTTGEPHPVEHFLEVLLIAQDRAVSEIENSLRQIWQVTIRDIETILADDPLEIVGARNRLAQRTDPEGLRLYACACQLLGRHDDANKQAKQALERARKG